MMKLAVFYTNIANVFRNIIDKIGGVICSTVRNCRKIVYIYK